MDKEKRVAYAQYLKDQDVYLDMIRTLDGMCCGSCEHWDRTKGTETVHPCKAIRAWHTYDQEEYRASMSIDSAGDCDLPILSTKATFGCFLYEQIIIPY